jgi:hypothetical protein
MAETKLKSEKRENSHRFSQTSDPPLLIWTSNIQLWAITIVDGLLPEVK